jgi:colanic acid biosynthesis glycosyl transferase WcaI
MTEFGSKSHRRPRALIISDRFTPEVSAASTRLHAHAKRWVKSGWDVDVLTCAPNFPRGKVFPGYKNRLYQRELLDGITVHRIWSYMAPNRGKFRRLLDYFSFNVSARASLKMVPRPDVILASSPPINVAWIAQAAARHFGVPWVFEVRDLWPASIRAVGISKGYLLQFVERQELALYKDAASIIVLTDAFKADLMHRGVQEAKISVVTNAVEPENFSYSYGRTQARHNLGLPIDKFVVGFVGTVGLAQGASTFVSVAASLEHRTDIYFVVVGEGAERPIIEKAAIDMKLTNIEFRDFVAHEKVPEILSALDVGAVLLKNDPVFETVIPSKIFEIMAARRPIVAAVRGQAKQVIEALGGGVCVAPEDATAFSQAILTLAEDISYASDLGQAGCLAVTEKYNRDKLAADALQVLRAHVDRNV